MARKKEPPKPMFALKHDFMDSLENVCQQALMLMQAVDMVVKHSDSAQGIRMIPDPIKSVLVERAKAMREALSSEG